MNNRYRLHLSYDGTDFYGWQKQPKQTSVQQVLEQALSQVLDQPITTIASGRTDAGVHAIDQVVHFNSNKDLKNYNLLQALNSLTPGSVAIKKIYAAPDDFHALHSATRKTYRYLIYNSATPSALRHRYSLWRQKPLNLEVLNQVSQGLLGEQDFKSFQSAGTPVKTTIRQIEKAHWSLAEPSLVMFEITGSGFLKQMVRNIVGSLLKLESEPKPLETLQNILGAKDRQAAYGTAPPQGLYLYTVEYPKSLDKKCRKI